MAIGVAALAAFVVGALWYSPILFGGLLMRLRGMDPSLVAPPSPPPLSLVLESVRVYVVGLVLARLLLRMGIANWKSAARLALLLWVGFPVVLLAGSVLWEGVPWQLALVHAGDWLAKLLLMAVILVARLKSGPDAQ